MRSLKHIHLSIKTIIVLLLIIVLALFGTCYYYLTISKTGLDVTNYVVESEKLNGEVKLAMISDVHDFHCTIKDRVIERMKEIAPDVILCNGDIIDKQSENDEKVIDFLKQLLAIAPVYMSLGNHEANYYENHPDEFNHLQEAGITLLEEDYVDLVIHKQSIRLGGMFAYAFGTNSGTITEEDMRSNSAYHYLVDFTATSSFKVMMAHRPDSFIFGEAYKWDIDCILSGHTHGGQMIFFGHGLYAPEQHWWPEYDYGRFTLGKQTLLITRGISSSHKIPRFNNPGEIVVVTLKG